ncbi:cytochrome-c peroxidase [Flavobacterium rhizosphaerae]|uniref:Cytochrome c peroxidase n=1 Tax=Flavobacterium rhizosphaerae TaxID=3163298 RepID=A0ABW8YRF3_9FLAO
MKMISRQLKYITLFLTASTVFFLYSFSSRETYTQPSTLKTLITSLNTDITHLDEVAQLYKAGKIPLDTLQKTVSQTRLSYKRAEFYLAFYFPEYTNDHFNGAPLLQIEKEGTRPKVVTPEGLQVLDELVYSDDAPEEKVQIGALCKKLHGAYIDLYDGIGNPDMTGVNGATAMRLQLIRIFSLGITGFDTPGSLNGLTEAKESLQAMQLFYEEQFSKSGPVNTLFNEAIGYLGDNTDFDTFNRLEFFKKYIDPLYKQLGEVNGQVPGFISNESAWNSKSTSVFAEDFLNPYFFTNLKQEEDNTEIRALGRSLFYDPALSEEGTVSCATCHQPEKAFTDGLSKSASNIQGKTVLRNAPTLLNAAYADRYFYDLRAFTLEQQAEHVIFNPEEFNTAYSIILKKLEKNQDYVSRFKKAFGKKGITRENFSKALASYVMSLKSFNSPMDKFLRGETQYISQEAQNGLNLFMGKAACATCHFAPTFAGLVPPLYNENESEILGVLKDPSSKSVDSDSGRIDNEVYTEYAWIYEKSFKTSTVRNAEKTAPYFHNGAYKTLEEVIDFYNEGGGAGMGLTVKNQTLAPDKLNLTEKEKKELIAFIKALTDTSAATQHH